MIWPVEGDHLQGVVVGELRGFSNNEHDLRMMAIRYLPLVFGTLEASHPR